MRRVQSWLVACSTVACTVLLATACSKDTARETVQTDSAIAPIDGAVNADAAATGVGNYVGLRHDPLPAGITSEGGAVLSGLATSYAFTRVHTPRGNMIWLDSVGSGADTRNRVVRAALLIPPLARDERLLMASCDAGAKLDTRVVAIVVNEPNVTKFTKIRQAWRVNERQGRFDVVPLAGISCEDPGSSP